MPPLGIPCGILFCLFPKKIYFRSCKHSTQPSVPFHLGSLFSCWKPPLSAMDVRTCPALLCGKELECSTVVFFSPFPGLLANAQALHFHAVLSSLWSAWGMVCSQPAVFGARLRPLLQSGQLCLGRWSWRRLSSQPFPFSESCSWPGIPGKKEGTVCISSTSPIPSPVQPGQPHAWEG